MMTISDMTFYKAFVSCIFAIEVGAATLYFRSVWIKEGYIGANKIFELFEVRTYYLHVMGFLFLFVVTGMIFMPPIIHYAFPWEAWTFVAAIFASVFGSEVVLDFKKAIKKMAPKNVEYEAPQHENDETTK